MSVIAVVRGSVTGGFFKEGWYGYSHKDSISAVQLDCQAPLERDILFKRENVGGLTYSNGIWLHGEKLPVQRRPASSGALKWDSWRKMKRPDIFKMS